MSIARCVVSALVSMWLVAGHGLPAGAQDAPIDPAIAEQNRKANAECFSCHSEAGLKNPPRADLDLAKLRETALDAAAFHGSDHGHMDCRQCHGPGYKDFPHPAGGKEATSPCSECHAAKVLRLEPQFNASVHARKTELKEKFTCHTCHDPHATAVARKLVDPRKIVAQDNHGCLECHDSDLTFARFAPEAEGTPGIKRTRPNIDRIHEWLPNAKLHWDAVRCVECHTPEVAPGKMLSHEILDKEKAERNCVSCHSRDTSLRTRLYRHLVKDEQQKFGFANSVILSSSYVVGATRHPLLDGIVIGLAALTLVGVLLHGALRIVAWFVRKRRSG